MPNNRDFHSTEVSRAEAQDKSVELRILTKVLKGSDNNIKKDNGNVDGETAMGTALHTFSNLAKQFFLKEDEFIPTKTAEQIDKGGIYAHDLEFFNLTTTCCQIDMFTLLRNGFHNGEGWVRGCKRFASACTNFCVIIQGNQNEQHGGQSSAALDYELGRFVDMEFLYQILILYKTRPKHRRPQDRIDFISKLRDKLVKDDDRNFYYFRHALDLAEEYDYQYPEPIATIKSWFNADEWYQIIRRVEDQVYQGMEAVVFNLSSMHSRAGAQVPFSSVNFGTCTSWEGRLVSKALLQAQWKGLGRDESPMFPIVIFKIKDGLNYEAGTRNHDLLLRAIQVSSKRLFPNFSFEDSSFNKPFWRNNDPLHEVAYMGCLDYKETVKLANRCNQLEIGRLYDITEMLWENNDKIQEFLASDDKEVLL
jgi:ribonucleoside-triphosphate reductase